MVEVKGETAWNILIVLGRCLAATCYLHNPKMEHHLFLSLLSPNFTFISSYVWSMLPPETVSIFFWKIYNYCRNLLL